VKKLIALAQVITIRTPTNEREILSYRAKSSRVRILNEVGLDPGLDHMR
jgi:saccharopine dehydrogenase-like NADP-dependent oxidoreductase